MSYLAVSRPPSPVLRPPAVKNETVVWFVFLPVAPVSTAGAAIPAMAGITVAMGLLCALLLGHLLCFHIYLSKSVCLSLSVSLSLSLSVSLCLSLSLSLSVAL